MGVVVPDPPEPEREVPIDAYCAVCGFKLEWRVVLGNKRVNKRARKKTWVKST